MVPRFLLGLRELQDELTTMQVPGLYWINCDRSVDAELLCRQCIGAQSEQARVTLIRSGAADDAPFTPLLPTALAQFSRYRLAESKAALMALTNDVTRATAPRQRLFVLLLPATQWKDFSTEQLQRWITHTAAWLAQRQCALVVVAHGSGVGRLRGILTTQHRTLYGLAHLQWQQDRAQYLIAWWSEGGGINANLAVLMTPQTQGWQLLRDEDDDPASITPLLNDENLFYAERSVLEGAPALSDHWQLLDSNAELAQQAQLTHSATLIFSLQQTQDVDMLARWVHSLRRQRGNALKIMIREMRPCLRSSDERLLLACGANIVVAHSEPLSRFLARLESVQGQRFGRHVPADVETLLTTMRPLQFKGYLPQVAFSNAVRMLIEHSLMPEGGKGILVALRPVPGLTAEQALPLCQLRRFGDVVTVAQQRLFIYLSTCRPNELETALKSIFRLPVNEIFSNRLVWSQDVQMLIEVKSLSQTREESVISSTVQSVVLPREERPASVPIRREPIGLALFEASSEGKTP
ncbi:cellulose biosynthesis protein BcsE [Candidatus Symbiopectobacterium sp. NZEC127]|uniref:cellulose biosynthesis protein BcsE n=1 Tax=Candidatus Symbiopectobacterium sp. NZEC127 TaxID=2820472 RepID=UPI0022273D2B|nr:cellulose biosynthesis protein BcsE [Candidatus Symbiopectobacterium sp. NZEC127]MCW2487805.1 cellulose biosynthesis protein BcsE [Candidatus Symbiopectobacterium sp. NZEC127]